MKSDDFIIRLTRVVIGISSIIFLLITGYGISVHTDDAPDMSVLAQNADNNGLSVTHTPYPNNSELAN